MTAEMQKELQRLIDFSKQIEVKPYEEVKKILDEKAEKAAKKSTESIAELFEKQYA